MLSSDSQSALLQGPLDSSGLLICECFGLYSAMVSKVVEGWRWWGEVGGGGMRCGVGVGALQGAAKQSLSG